MPGGGSHGEMRGPPGPAGSTLSGSDLRDTDRGPSAQGMFLRLRGMDVAQRNRAAGSAWLGHWHSDSEKDGRLPVTWGDQPQSVLPKMLTLASCATQWACATVSYTSHGLLVDFIGLPPFQPRPSLAWALSLSLSVRGVEGPHGWLPGLP